MSPDPRRVLVVAHTARRDARELSRALRGTAPRPRHRGPDARRGGRRHRARRRFVDARAGRRDRRGRAGLRAGRRASAATGRSCGPPSSPDADGARVLGRQHRSRRVPRRGRGRGRRRHDRGHRHPHYTTDERLTLDVSVPSRRRGGGPDLRAQRGQRREGRARTDARGRRGDRRPAAVAVGLRRRGVRDPDRLHRLQLLRRRPGGLAERRGALRRAAQRARAVRPSARGRPDLGGRRRGALAERPARACCGATAAAPSTCRPAPGSRYAAAPGRCGWCGCTRRPFTDRLVAKFGLSVEGWRGRAERRRPAEDDRCLRRSASSSSGVIDSSTLELGSGADRDHR